MGTWCNDITVKSSSDGGSGDDKVLQKIANAGFVDAASKKWLEITSCFEFNYMKSKISGRGVEHQSPQGWNDEASAYPEVHFIQNGCLQ